MSRCKTTCQLCPRLIISQAVTFAADTLTINIPAGSYQDGCKYCIVVAQAIPDATTINAGVVITIGAGTVEYPLTDRDGAQLTAAALRTRTRYATRVSTTATGGAFNLIGKACCAPDNSLTAIDGTDATAVGA